MDILNHKLVANLDSVEKTIFFSFLEKVQVASDQIVVSQGEESRDLYLIESGLLEVIKDGHLIMRLHPGDSFGELSLLNSILRTTTIKVHHDAQLLRLSHAQWLALKTEQPELYTRLVEAMAYDLGDKLTKTNEVTLINLKDKLRVEAEKLQMGVFTTYVFAILFIYNLCIDISKPLSKSPLIGTVVSVVIIFIILLIFSVMLKRMKLGLADVGLTLKDWQPALLESGLWTGGILLFMWGVKYFLVHHYAALAETPIIDISSRLSTHEMVINYCIYILFSPVQEFIARGVMQGVLTDVYSERQRKGWRAIIVSNILFSATHVHLSSVVALLVILPGILWGYLYRRHPTLLGVSLSHIFIGLFGIFFFNFPKTFAILFAG